MKNRLLTKETWTRKWTRLQVLTLLLVVLAIFCLLTAKW
jgi:hypothetical protein